MPSMFSRRRASSQPPQHTAPPSSSAAIAASAAFLNKSPSAASLSSAAATAALRSHTTSPEPVGSIQTKRMVRRGSQSSIGGGSIMGTSSSNGAGRGMVRQNSSSSMTERSFRSPSPGGRGGAMSPVYNAPPVPSIPRSIPKGQRRSASLDVPTRITSPTYNGDRSNYLDDPRQSKKTGLPKLAELEREDSNRSVNFSRPWSPAQGQAQAPRRPHSSVGWSTSPTVGSASSRGDTSDRPQSSVGFSSPNSSNVQQKVQNAAQKPVLKKKKQAGNEGARFANGTMTTATTTQSTTQTPASTVADPNTATDGTTPAKKKIKAVAFPLDTQVSGNSSASPVKLSPSGSDTSRSPASPRSPTTLHKQPSVVREDPEAEASAEVEPTPTKNLLSKSLSLKGNTRTINTSEGPAQNYVAPGGTPHNRSVSLDIPRENGQRRSSESSSPSRKVHAHFVEGSLIATPAYVKHQPPPRSVSPYKSALKHSPSPSIRTTSPNVGTTNGSIVPNSDASDTTSLASQDGIKTTKKKKKSARVSFDDGSIPISPVPETGVGRRDLSGSFSGDENYDEFMKPRPALPSFGSVRGRKNKVQPDVSEKVTETLPSSMSTSTSTLPDRSDMSSDQFIGAAIANHHASKFETSSTDPLPPQLKSVESTGYNSDSSYSEDDAGKQIQSSITLEKVPLNDKPIAEQPEPDVFENSNKHNIAVPDISVQPATPGIEEETQLPLYVPVEKSFSMPGGWDEAEETSVKNPPTKYEHEETHGKETESSDDESNLQPLPIGAERHPPLLQPIYESDSDSDDSAAFSDAAEDPSEFEGGFASLDAILESPAGPRSSGAAVSTPPDSPTAQIPASRQPTLQSSPLSQEPVVGEDGDWRQATAYWSSLSKTKKLEIERDSRPVEETTQLAETAPKPKKKRDAQNSPAVITDPSFFAPPQKGDSLINSKAPQEQPNSRGPALRKSMRGTAESATTNGEPHLRKSMRGSAEPVPAASETHMRKSMRAGAPAGTPAGGSMRSSMRGNDGGQRRAAPPSSSANGASSPPASAGAIAGARAQATKKPAKPFVAPLPAYDSDSESSFKKKRRGSVSTVDSVGHYAMKRSMRSGSVDAGPQQRSMRSGSVDAGPQQRPTSPPSATRGSGRLSLRSLSPTGSFANRGENIRASLRGTPVNDAPTMRGKNSKAARDSKSPSRFSMSGFSKPKPSAAPPSSTRSKFSSRFAADSDDEDDAAPASRGGFRSRFADSDEEDSPVGPPRRVPADLAPVRGIPRRRDQDSDSTDLDDSEDERSRGRVSKRPGVPSQSDIDAAMAAARRNVAAMNGGREPGVAETRPETADSNQTTAVQSEVPSTPNRKKGFMGSLMGRRRSSSVQPGSPMSVQSQPTASRPPKLQRRNTPQNWPLSPPPKINGDDDRPATSDGTVVPPMKKTMRPDLGRRSMSGNDLKNITDGGTYSERTGKKKKFSRLRKVFGLDD